MLVVFLFVVHEQAKSMPLHYSEYGLGGGRSQAGNVTAVTAAGAASSPFFGAFPRTYTPKLDPWRIPAVAQLMTKFWQTTLSWLKKASWCDYHGRAQHRS